MAPRKKSFEDIVLKRENAGKTSTGECNTIVSAFVHIGTYNSIALTSRHIFPLPDSCSIHKFFILTSDKELFP